MSVSTRLSTSHRGTVCANESNILARVGAYLQTSWPRQAKQSGWWKHNEPEMSRSIRMELPSSAEEGWTRHQENAAKPPLMERTGWCWSTKCIWFINTTPSARAKVASRLFLNRAATPPQLRRGVPFGCFATFIEKSAHPEFLEVRRSDLRLPRLLQSRLIRVRRYAPPIDSSIGPRNWK